MSDVDKTREQTMRNKDLRAYIAQRMSNSVVTRHFSCSAEECDDHRKTDSPINEVMEAIEVRLAEARNAALDDLLEAMPKKYESYAGFADWQEAHNNVIDTVTATIHQLRSPKKVAD